MEQILAKHPDLRETLTRSPQLKQYRILSEKDVLLEQWEKNNKGHWIDVTEREKLKERIAAEQEELERLRKKEQEDAK